MVECVKGENEDTIMPKYTITMVGYNSKPWIHKSIESALNQKHDSFELVVVDAHTTDGTYDILCEYKDKYPDKIKLFRNEERKYPLENACIAVDNAEGEIMISLDFDDWLAHNNVLTTLDRIYDNAECEMTYGSYADYYETHEGVYIIDRPRPMYPLEVIQTNSYRKHGWYCTHLRTFKKELFNKVDRNEFIDPDTGKFWDMAGDVAMMFGMIERCDGRFVAIQETLYIYNKGNPLSEDKSSLQHQLDCERKIRTKVN